jgi:hypothetical protein
MQTFKNLPAAAEAANGLPILHVNSGMDTLYIVLDGNVDDMKRAEVALLTPCDDREQRHVAAGHLMLEHLDRLGNANWATMTRPTRINAFPRPRAAYGE